MEREKRIMFICPHWHMGGNVGVLRARRMVGWLQSDGFEITIVAAGPESDITDGDFRVITIPDRLGIFGKHPVGQESDGSAGLDSASDEGISTDGYIKKRKPNKFRRFAAYFLLVPDLGIIWARSVMRSPVVRTAASECGWFLASSPPESAFVPARSFAKKYGGKFIMDMRDGWIDEPMKPLLRTSLFQRWREVQVERRMITQAHTILVTSPQWKSMLEKRYPDHSERIRVITNAYPSPTAQESVNYPAGTDSSDLDKTRPGEPQIHIKRSMESGKINILHAGRFSSSRPERNMHHLFQPLFNYARLNRNKADISLIGDLTDEEALELNEWNRKFTEVGWNMHRIPQLEHSHTQQLLSEGDILLMLSSSVGSIPAKMFDYIAAGRPILGAVLKNSAASWAASGLPQAFLYDLHDEKAAERIISRLFKRLTENRIESGRPVDFEPSHLRGQFLKIFQ